MTDELKPVAEVTKDEDLRWLPASSKRLAGSKLYAIPPTHRVVSVELLREAMTASYLSNPDLHERLTDIIKAARGE